MTHDLEQKFIQLVSKHVQRKRYPQNKKDMLKDKCVAVKLARFVDSSTFRKRAGTEAVVWQFKDRSDAGMYHQFPDHSGAGLAVGEYLLGGQVRERFARLKSRFQPRMQIPPAIGENQ